MNARFLAKFPVKRQGALNTHPEISHLKVLLTMALNCGNHATLVEVGTTNGAVTGCLAHALKALPDAQLVVVGPLTEAAASVIEELGVGDRVAQVDDIREISGRLDLVFIADPEKAEAATWAVENQARVICVYDVRTAERYRLPQFAPLAEVSAALKQLPDRVWNELSNAVSFEQARRGMLISESRHWSPPTRSKPSKAQVVNDPKPEKPAVVNVPEPAVVVPVAPPVSDPQPQEEIAQSKSEELELEQDPKPAAKKRAKFKKKGKGGN